MLDIADNVQWKKIKFKNPNITRFVKLFAVNKMYNRNYNNIESIWSNN